MGDGVTPGTDDAHAAGEVTVFEHETGTGVKCGRGGGGGGGGGWW